MSKLEHIQGLKRKASGGGQTDADPLSPMDRRVKRRLITPKRIIAGLGVVCLLVILGGAYWRYGLTRSLTVGAERVTVAEVSYGTFREYIPVTGNVVPRETVYLDAVEGGQVTEIHAEEGAMVEAGEPLLRLKNTNLQLEVIGTEAQLTEQVNNLHTTRLSMEQNRLSHKRELIEIDRQIADVERQLVRRRPLAESGAASQAEIQDLEADREYLLRLRDAVAEAQEVDRALQTKQTQQLNEAVDRISENLAIARENLENLVIRAPITGQLTVFDANIGESLSRGQRVGQVDQVDDFKVSAFVDEFYLGRVRLGQTATVEIDGAEHTLEVVKIYPNIRNRQFEIDLAFRDGPPETARRGQTLRMDLEIGAASESLLLANGPFIDDTNGDWVFVLGPDGETAMRRPVETGRRNPDRVEVLQGLAEGERVIVSSYDRFLNFERIDLTGGG